MAPDQVSDENEEMALSLLKAFLILSIVGIGSFVWAEDSSSCQDLYKATCDKADTHDGTGVSQSGNKLVKDRVAQIQSEFEPKIIEHYKNLVPTLSKNERLEMLDAFGLESSEECSGPNLNSIKCFNLIAENAAYITGIQFFPFSNGKSVGKKMDFEGIAKFYDSLTYDSTMLKFSDEMNARIYDPAMELRVNEKMLPEMKKLMIQKIESAVSDEKQKELLIQKIKLIKMSPTKSGCGSSLSQKFSPNAYYHPQNHEVAICPGFYHFADSDFSLAFALSHELAHSIDPCLIEYPPGAASKDRSVYQKAFQNKNPFEDVIQCLRSPKSIEAKPMKTFSIFKPKPGKENRCMGDQIGESFCDWMAGEIAPEYIAKNHQLSPAQYKQGYSNVFRFGCRNEKRQEPSLLEKVAMLAFPSLQDPHPELEDRANRITAASPRIRKDMKCTTKPAAVYCSTGSQSSSNPHSGRRQQGTQ